MWKSVGNTVNSGTGYAQTHILGALYTGEAYELKILYHAAEAADPGAAAQDEVFVNIL